MVRRVRFDLSRTCDCGSQGVVTFEEDDIHEHMEGGANTEAVAVTGPFRLTADGIVCTNCEARKA